MIRIAPRFAPAEEIVVIAVRAWIAASALFGVGTFALVAVMEPPSIATADELLMLLVAVPVALLFCIFGAGLASVVLALPVGFGVGCLLRALRAGPAAAVVSATLLGVAIGVMLERLQWPDRMLPVGGIAAPLYALVFGMTYARMTDG